MSVPVWSSPRSVPGLPPTKVPVGITTLVGDCKEEQTYQTKASTSVNEDGIRGSQSWKGDDKSLLTLGQ